MSLDFKNEDGLLNTEKLYSWNNNIQIYNYTFQNNFWLNEVLSTA